MSPIEQSQWIKEQAIMLGFDACRIAPAEPIGRKDYLQRWLEAGRAGTMDYLHRHLSMREDPRNLLPEAKSVVAVALSYNPNPGSGTHSTTQTVESSESTDLKPIGKIARYAWGRDYHKVVKKRLFALADRMRERFGHSFESRACVDTAPIVEREIAERSGLGWIGKNTLVLNTELGSYFFLGELVTTLKLAADEPVTDHCGSCTACLDACPTNAFPNPHEMDASRCISYLTIERRKALPADLTDKLAGWLFGCDICQEVCPFNRKAKPTVEIDFSPRPPAPEIELRDVLSWSEEDYHKMVQGSAIKRAALAMLQRNARHLLDVRDNPHNSPPA